MAERGEIGFLLASLNYCFVLASLTVRSDQSDEIRARAFDAYERTLRFADRVQLTGREKRILEPLAAKDRSKAVVGA